MLASYLPLALFATVALSSPIAQNTISGSGGVTINGQPAIPGTGCVIAGQQIPAAQCPAVPDHGLVCVVNGNLVTGAACNGQPDVIDLGPAPAAR